jgi:hypothetical protein
MNVLKNHIGEFITIPIMHRATTEMKLNPCSMFTT